MLRLHVGALLLPMLAVSAYADNILGTQLASFSVLGATTAVTNTGATTLTGDIGVSPALSITGEATITVNGTNAATIGNPSVHTGDATATSAQTQLGIAIADLGLLGPGTLEPADLVGLTLAPGVYTVPAGVSNLTGTLTLDGMGNANAFWVFQFASSFITSSSSVVDVINTGSGAGVYWNVGSSATLGSSSTLQGNILASTSITMGAAVTIGCGRALANTGDVTMINDTISIGCTNVGSTTTDTAGSTPLLLGSNGLSGGLSVTPGVGGSGLAGTGTPVGLPFAPVSELTPVPEPTSVLLLSSVVGAFLRLRKFRRVR